MKEVKRVAYGVSEEFKNSNDNLGIFPWLNILIKCLYMVPPPPPLKISLPCRWLVNPLVL